MSSDTLAVRTPAVRTKLPAVGTTIFTVMSALATETGAVNLGQGFPDFDRIAAALGPRTRAILVNSPHNPSATVWSREDMLRLQDLLAPTDVLLISDEVYEHMVFDGQQHQSASRFPALAARSFIVSSF